MSSLPSQRETTTADNLPASAAASTGAAASSGAALPVVLPQWAERETAILAPYAMHGVESQGRRYLEPLHAYRGPFERDRNRLVHSAAYRRLSFKTQVFTGESGDYHRTRLTHTLEVASIARTLGRALRLNEDLVEALALAHDIGHPPFGHAGEDVLAECLAEEGGFSHNGQALRIFERLEQRYPDFPGLNLTAEVLEGQATRVAKQTAATSPLLEVQVVEAADSIAYDTHDADDALHLGLLQLDELVEMPLWAAARQRVARKYADLQGDILQRAILHELIDWQVSDLLAGAERRIAATGVDSAAAVRAQPWLIVASDELAQSKAELERFLYNRVYRHKDVLRVREESQAQLREMFEQFVQQPQRLPLGFQRRIAEAGLRRTVGDYIAGMTDRYAQQEYRRLCGT